MVKRKAEVHVRMMMQCFLRAIWFEEEESM